MYIIIRPRISELKWVWAVQEVLQINDVYRYSGGKLIVFEIFAYKVEKFNNLSYVFFQFI